MSRQTTKMPDAQMTAQEAEEQLAVYAKADATAKKIQSQMDLEIAKIREKNAERLNALALEKQESFNKLMVYANQNQDLFKVKKSLDMSHGKIGFRTGTPTLKNMKGFTWGAVLELAKEHAPQYVRTKEELNKEALLLDRTLAESTDVFGKLKVEVKQEESFYVELKKEETPVL